MIHCLESRNVNEAFSDGFWWLKTQGYKRDSRNGPVIVSPDPVVTTYRYPRERILWNEKRDANPFFHLMECIWMMAGRADVDWIAQFNSRMREYAEDDGKQWGAYGHRWLHHFGINQLMRVVDDIKINRDSRQAVLAMWDPSYDLGAMVKDKPCNTHVYFSVSPGGFLDMTVCCRSNDVLWGAYGANAVHFSFLQEVVAWFTGYNAGRYTQFSNNYHAYLDVPMAADFLENPPPWDYDPYRSGELFPEPIFNNKDDRNGIQVWLNDCQRFCKGDPCDNAFLENVAAPMRDYYLERKRGIPDSARILHDMPECDWKHAALRWAERRV